MRKGLSDVQLVVPGMINRRLCCMPANRWNIGSLLFCIAFTEAWRRF